jgi:hypothetical protein
MGLAPSHAKNPFLHHPSDGSVSTLFLIAGLIAFLDQNSPVSGL